MRQIQKPQSRFGQVDIANIKIDPKSRDDIPAILIGLQTVYTTDGLRDCVFDILSEVMPCVEA